MGHLVHSPGAAWGCPLGFPQVAEPFGPTQGLALGVLIECVCVCVVFSLLLCAQMEAFLDLVSAKGSAGGDVSSAHDAMGELRAIK